jgi:uncharacterized protein (TIGR03437 family)
LQPGVVTAGKGTLSLSNVTPGGGVVPAGYALTIQGTGFTPSTAVEIEGVAIASSEFPGPDLIKVTLAAPTEMSGKRVRLRNPDGAQVEYWAWLHYSPELFAGSPASACGIGCKLIFPLNAAAAASLGRPFASPHPAHGFELALQNPNPVPVEVTITEAGKVQERVSDIIPAWGSRHLLISNPPNTAVQTNPPMPIRILGFDYSIYGVFGSLAGYPAVRLANAAGGFVDSVAPGEIISIYGLNLGVQSPSEGTRVLFDGVPAPLLYVSTSQINATVPYEVAGQQFTTIRVEHNRETNATWGAPVVAAAPGIFLPVLNQDNSVNSPASPAARGSIIQIFATGEGAKELRKPVPPVSVSIGAIDAPVQYAGSAPDAIAGLFQVNVQVPQSLAPSPGAQIVLMVGSASSQNYSPLAVK